MSPNRQPEADIRGEIVLEGGALTILAPGTCTVSITVQAAEESN